MKKNGKLPSDEQLNQPAAISNVGQKTGTDGRQTVEYDDFEFAANMVGIAGSFNSSLDLDVVYDHIIDSLSIVIPTTTSNFMVVTGNEGHVVRQRGYDKLGTAEIVSSRIFDLQKVKTFAEMLTSRQEVCIPDVYEDPDWVRMPESFWIRSFISAPIIIHDRVYGFLNCDHGVTDTFTLKHATRLKMVAEQAAIAIQNALEYSEIKQRLKQIALINEITQTMLESKQLEEVLRILPEKILPIFDANSLLISKWNTERQIASGISVYGPGLMPNLPKEDKPGEIGITEEIIRLKHPVVISFNNEYAPWLDRLNTLTTDRVVLALPLIAQEIPLGAIFIGFKDHKQITQAEISVGEYAATQIAAIIHKSNIYDQAKIQSLQFQHANDLIASLSIVATSTMSTKGLQDIIHTMGDGLEKMHIHSLLFFIENDSEMLTLQYCSRMSKLSPLLKSLNYTPRERIVFDIPASQSFRSTLFEQKIEFIDNPMELLKLTIPPQFGPFIAKFQEALDIGSETNSLFMPLVAEHKTIGLLGLYGVNLQEIDLKAGEIFNSQISVAFENARLLAEVQRLAVTDELTGIKNRRGLFESGNRELATSRRLDRKLGVLMIDLDNFKEINDKYGHLVGDSTLHEIARRIAENVREIDIVGRYGGEEFVVLLIENDLPAALAVAERIRHAVADAGIQTEAGTINLTISIGVDELDASTTSLDQLIRRADLALYVAKRSGRNQVATLSDIKNPPS